MKILSLRLSNLASIAGEQHIDFEQEPLKTAGLIAITGITGAGKTTLLDAICLALFDQVPRLQHAEANKKMVDASGEDVQVNSTVNILRRGCVQGFAEVEFIAQDYKHYLARWEVKRARLKANGRMQSVLRTLRCISDDQLISEQAKECNKRIIELLGLDFKQFTRAVLLAQSEVTAFLKAKDNERADLLEYLTNSDIYSRIGMASFAATKQAREKVEAIEKKMGEHMPLTPAERDDLLLQLHSSQQQLEQLKQQQQRQQKQLDWYQQQQQFEQTISAQQLHLTTVQQQWAEAEPQRVLLEQLDQFEPIRATFIQSKQLKQSHADTTAKQKACEQDTHRLAEQLKQQQLYEQQQRDIYSTLQQQQDALKPQLQRAAHYEHSMNSLNDSIRQQQSKLEQLNTQLAPKLAQQHTLQQQQDEHTTALNQQLKILQQSQEFVVFDAEPQAAILSLQKAAKLRDELLQQQADIFNTPITEQHEQLSQLNQQLNELTTQHISFEAFEKLSKDTQQNLDSQHKHLSSCERLADQLKQWMRVEQHIRDLAQQCTEQTKNLAPIELLVQQTTQQTKHAEQQLKTTQQLVHEHRLLTTQSATDLRKQLKPEQACMVCGSTEHPFYDPQNLLNALNQQFDEQLQRAEHALQEARLQELQQQQAFTKVKSTLEQLATRQQQLQHEKKMILDEIKRISPKFYQHIESNLSLEFANRKLKEIQENISERKNTLEQEFQQQQSQLKAWQQQEKQRQQLQNLLAKREELNELEQQTIGLLSDTWVKQWQQHCAATKDQCVQCIDQRRHANTQVKILNEQITHAQQTLSSLEITIKHEQTQRADINQSLQTQQTQQQDTEQLLKTLFSQYATPLQVSSCADWQQQLEQNAHQQLNKFNQANQQVQLSDKAYSKQQQQLDYLLQELANIQRLLAQTTQDIEQWQQTQQQNNRKWQWDTLEQLIQIDHVQKKQLAHEQQQLQQTQQQAKNTLDIYNKQYHQHLLSKPELDQIALQDAVLAQNQRIDQLDEQCTALKLKKMQDEQQQQQSTQYIAQLEKAKAEHHRWNKISSLIGDAKGATFKKLAQQFHLQMLVDLANQQLTALTPRYELRCIEDSLSLTIVDHFMNDEVRPVLSLSGGESFLVSLALALGIANMASGTTKLESLFIDEGFGTLDQSSLHIVMDALDRLQSQGRKVILISHIADMHERIPVKIQVMPQGSGASKIEVVG